MVLRLTHFNTLAVAAIASLLLSGCMREPPPAKMISIDATDAGQKALAEYDTNKDGKISGPELDKAASLKDGLAGFNTTKDKGVTAAMITERITKWQDVYKTGLMGGVMCQVNKGGKPLAGAEVKFVPETFLGENMKVGVGTTGPDGIAMMAVPTTSADEGQGIPPGWYKIQVTKGAEVPAKYNTQTTIGVEVAPDVRRNSGIVVDIK